MTNRRTITGRVSRNSELHHKCSKTATSTRGPTPPQAKPRAPKPGRAAVNPDSLTGGHVGAGPFLGSRRCGPPCREALTVR
jgi:hypothetical protein